MIYHILKIIVRFHLLFFFKRIYLNGVDKIPAFRPLILTANHSNALIDALLFGVFLRRPVYFLARADIFKNNILRWFFAQIHMMPVYRFRDGYENLHKNQSSFDQSDQLLATHKAIVIFPEGTGAVEKRLRPLLKGTARLAFQALEQSPDLEVVPVGLNYTNHTEFRSEVIVQVGEPLAVAQFQRLLSEHPAKAILEFNRQLRQKLLDNLVIVEPPHGAATECLLQMMRTERTEPRFPVLRTSVQRFEAEQQTAARVRALAQGDPIRFDRLTTLLTDYFDQLESLKVSDEAVFRQGKGRSWYVQLFGKIAQLLRPVFLFSTDYALQLAQRRASEPQFLATLTVGYQVVFGFFLSVLVFFISAVSVGWWWGILIITIWFSMSYAICVLLEKQERQQKLDNFNRLKNSKSGLVEQRQQIRQIFRL